MPSSRRLVSRSARASCLVLPALLLEMTTCLPPALQGRAHHALVVAVLVAARGVEMDDAEVGRVLGSRWRPKWSCSRKRGTSPSARSCPACARRVSPLSRAPAALPFAAAGSASPAAKKSRREDCSIGVAPMRRDTDYGDEYNIRRVYPIPSGTGFRPNTAYLSRVRESAGNGGAGPRGSPWARFSFHVGQDGILRRVDNPPGARLTTARSLTSCPTPRIRPDGPGNYGQSVSSPPMKNPNPQNRIAMRARVHDFLLDDAGDFTMDAFRHGDVGGLPRVLSRVTTCLQ